MAWFGEGLSNLKGQITNFTKDIVASNVVGLGLSDTTDNAEPNSVPEQDGENIHNANQSQLHPSNQDQEVARLRKENEELRRMMTIRQHQGPRDRRVSEEASLECEGAGGVNCHLPLVPVDEAGADSFLGQEQIPKDVKAEEEISSLRSRLRQTFQEKVLMEQSCSRLEREVALLTRQVTEDRQQAQAGAEARRSAVAACRDCHKSTQTEGGAVGSSGTTGNVPRSSQETAALVHENEQLRRERAQLRSELGRMSRAVQELESQVAVSQDENANLSTGMEELDIQHQEAIQQIMVLKDSTQKRYESLLEEFEEMKSKYDEMVKQNEEREQSKSEASTSDGSSELRLQILNELSEEIRKMITTEIPDKYFETSKKDASVLETVAAVEKMLSHTTSRVESSEGKIRDLLVELRRKDDEVQEIEEENRALRTKLEELKEQEDNLPTIAENSEDLEALEIKVMALENEVGILREVRSNLEVEHNNSRSEIESLIRQLHSAEAMSRNQDNLQTEVRKYMENERELMKKLDSAEHTREEMLTEISLLKSVIEEQKSHHLDSIQNKQKIEELTSINNQLHEQLLKLKENEKLFLNISEELQQEKAACAEIKKEKEKLFDEITNLKNTEETSRKQSDELQDEQNVRLQLETENNDLKQKLITLQATEEKYLKLLENFRSESNTKKELEVTLDTMHAEMKRIEEEEEARKQVLEKQSFESDLKIKELKALNSCLTQKCVKFEKEIFELSESLDCLKIETESKGRKLCEIILEKSVAEKELEETKEMRNALQKELDELKVHTDGKEKVMIKEFDNFFLNVLKVSSLQIKNTFEFSDFQEYLNKIASQFSLLEQEKQRTLSEKSALSETITKLSAELNDKSESISKMTQQIETLQVEKRSMEDTLRNLKETVSTGNQTDQPDSAVTSQENLAEVKKKLEIQEAGLRETEERYQKLLSSSEQSLNHVNEQLRTLNAERQQLIETVQRKHAECVQYHEEIQRLCAELTTAEQQRLTASEQFQQKLEEKEEQLAALQASGDRQVAALSEQVHTLQNQLEYVSQLLRVTDRQEAEGMPASPPSAENQTEKNEVDEKETRRMDELYENLQQEQLRNKYLQDEVSEQHEKEASLMKELQRLRSHLVMVEENYTQEMLRAEQQVQELNQRLGVAEERAKSSSTAYTSASIRANQHVESLSSQLRQVTEQRERLSSQLSAAEDKLLKQAAALTNLQAVLEQFQRDKERDVAAETERIRRTVDAVNSKNTELTNEIRTLQAQLKEAKEGLSAASRLSEQLDHKSNIITDLKQQVVELEEKLKKAEERVQAASMSVEGKVDRCLVRNLVVGYVSAPPSSRLQALGVIATVLDFSAEDRQRSGLESGPTPKQQSLSEAFIRFLESESRPQPHLRLPSQDSAEGSRSRKTSVSEVGLTPARRISGSVLKDVLKQDL